MTALEFLVHLDLEGLPPDHPACEEALGELMADLRDVPSLVHRDHGSIALGRKGAVSELVLALGTSGTVGGLVRVFHLWLQRDRRRSLVITSNVGAERRVVKIEGDNISTEIVSQALHSITDFASGPIEEGGAERPN